MKPVLVAYATREGHTAHVAEAVAKGLRARGVEADVVDVASPPATFDVHRYQAAVLAASVHAGRHESEMVAFAKAHRCALEDLPCSFLSVSLSEAGAEDRHATDEQRARSRADVSRMSLAFLQETGLRPQRLHPVAGALLYSKYGFALRLVMRLIAHRAGAPTDPAHDYVFTDWVSLDRFAGEIAAQVLPHAA